MAPARRCAQARGLRTRQPGDVTRGRGRPGARPIASWTAGGAGMTRATLWALLTVVTGAAAVLSFSAPRDLALLCGFALNLA